MYGGKSSDVKASSNPMSIGIHTVKVASAEAFTTEENAKGLTYDVLDIKFKNKAEETHTIRCFSPDADDDKVRQAKNAEYYSKLVVYIASKLHNKEVELPKVKSWAEFTKAACELLKGDDALELKLTGNVWNGRASVVVTRYFGWLERADDAKSPKMSTNELKANAEYEASVNGVDSDDSEDDPF